MPKKPAETSLPATNMLDKLVAHRGWQKRYPENTQPAIEQAIAVGARHIEFDIQLTADHVPVLYHDKVLDRISGIPGSLHNLPFSEVSKLSAHEPGRFGTRYLNTNVFSLAQCVELLKSHPHIHYYAEIKRSSLKQFGHEATLDAILPVIAPIAEQCI